LKATKGIATFCKIMMEKVQGLVHYIPSLDEVREFISEHRVGVACSAAAIGTGYLL